MALGGPVAMADQRLAEELRQRLQQVRLGLQVLVELEEAIRNIQAAGQIRILIKNLLFVLGYCSHT